MKTCTKCGETKELEAFNKHRRHADGYQTVCRECGKKACASYYGANKKKVSAMKAKWAKANREKIRVISARWRKAHRDLAIARVTAWAKANPGAVNATTAKRYTSKLRACPPWADLDAIKAIYTEARSLGLHVDHVVPLQGDNVCGLHVPWNLEPLCPIKNRSKGNKLLV